MADNTQGKPTQKDPASGSNAKAVDRGEQAAAARDDSATQTARATAPARSASRAKEGPNPLWGGGEGPSDDQRPSAEEIAKRVEKAYRATERGYVDGRVVEAGDNFSTKMDQGLWMEPVKAGSQRYGAEEAAEEAQYARKLDVNYEGMSEPGLEALAALVGVSDPGKLKKDDLVAAIRAARDNTR